MDVDTSHLFILNPLDKIWGTKVECYKYISRITFRVKAHKVFFEEIL